MSKFKFLIVTAIVGVALTASSAFAACGDYGPVTLRKGSNGVYVQTLQTQLALTADGVFGAKTEAAVKAFQLGKGLSADGVVGVQTKAALAAACATTTTPVVTTPVTTTPSLSGDAGDIDTITTVSKNVEDVVKEGEEDVNVLGLKIKAIDSDISLTNVKVLLQKNNSVGSDRLTKYIEEVKVLLGDEEVGSADADEFSRKSLTGNDEFTKSISLKNAVVKKGETAYLYVAVSAISSVDDEGADWDVSVTTIRFTDGTGAIMSDSGIYSETFGFDPQGADDEFTVKKSSANPDASTIKVEEDDESDDTLVGAFKIEVDEDSSDIALLELPLIVTIGGNDVSLESIEDVISEVYVKIDGEQFDADLDDDTDFSGVTGSATYIVEFDDEDMVIDAGDTVEVKIYIVFNEQGGAEEDAIYSNGTTVSVSVEDESIDAEGDDELTNDGSFTGKTHTLSAAPAIIDGFSWTVASTGTYIDLFFSVEAEDEDFDVLLDDVIYSKEGTLGEDSVVLTKYSGTALTNGTGDFTVEEGDTARFRVRFNLTGTNGQWAEITIDSVSGQTIPEDKETSPTATRNVNS